MMRAFETGDRYAVRRACAARFRSGCDPSRCSAPGAPGKAEVRRVGIAGRSLLDASTRRVSDRFVKPTARVPAIYSPSRTPWPSVARSPPAPSIREASGNGRRYVNKPGVRRRARPAARRAVARQAAPPRAAPPAPAAVVRQARFITRTIAGIRGAECVEALELIEEQRRDGARGRSASLSWKTPAALARWK